MQVPQLDLLNRKKTSETNYDCRDRGGKGPDIYFDLLLLLLLKFDDPSSDRSRKDGLQHDIIYVGRYTSVMVVSTYFLCAAVRLPEVFCRKRINLWSMMATTTTYDNNIIYYVRVHNHHDHTVQLERAFSPFFSVK